MEGLLAVDRTKGKWGTIGDFQEFAIKIQITY